MWAAYSSDGERFVAVNGEGALQLWDLADGDQLASSPGRGVANRGAVAFTADGTAVVVADADGTVTELDGHTLEPTGRSLDVGVEPGALRAGGGGVVAATASLVSVDSDSSEIVFADFDDGRVLRRVRVPLAPGAGNFSPDGSSVRDRRVRRPLADHRRRHRHDRRPRGPCALWSGRVGHVLARRRNAGDRRVRRRARPRRPCDRRRAAPVPDQVPPMSMRRSDSNPTVTPCSSHMRTDPSSSSPPTRTCGSTMPAGSPGAT